MRATGRDLFLDKGGRRKYLFYTFFLRGQGGLDDDLGERVASDEDLIEEKGREIQCKGTTEVALFITTDEVLWLTAKHKN